MSKSRRGESLRARSERIGGKLAPAVGLLLLGDSAVAGTPSDSVAIPEPATLGLLAIGAAAGGAVAYIRNKRKK